MRNITLGEKIRDIRKGLGLNQLEFAKKLGFKSATAVSKFEDNSREPDKNKLIDIAKMGNVTLDELLTSDIFKEESNSVYERPAFYGSKTSDMLFSSDQKINIEEAIGKTYKVLKAGTALSVALYMNIQQFAAALDTGQALKVCQDQMKAMQEQIDALNAKVDRLEARPGITEGQGDGSEKKAM